MAVRCLRWQAAAPAMACWLVLQTLLPATAYPQAPENMFRDRDYHPTGFDRETSPCPTAVEPAMPHPSGSGCTKLIYLHIPKCGGHSVVPTLAAIPGFDFMFHRTFDFNNLYSDEMKDPLARKNLGFELHFGSPTFATVFPQLLHLRQRYRQVGCRAALVTLYRKPADLLQSWHAYRSKSNLRSLQNRQLTMPGFLSWAAECGRSNVMVNWLRTNSWSKRVPHTRASVTQLGDMLDQFDIADQLDAFDLWLVRVLDFLQVPRGECQQVSWVNYTAPVAVVPKILLDVELPRVPANVDVCKVNRRAIQYLYETLTNIDKYADRTIPSGTMASLTRWDRVLYNQLRAGHGARRLWGGQLKERRKTGQLR